MNKLKGKCGEWFLDYDLETFRALNIFFQKRTWTGNEGFVVNPSFKSY